MKRLYWVLLRSGCILTARVTFPARRLWVAVALYGKWMQQTRGYGASCGPQWMLRGKKACAYPKAALYAPTGCEMACACPGKQALLSVVAVNLSPLTDCKRQASFGEAVIYGWEILLAKVK